MKRALSSKYLIKKFLLYLKFTRSIIYESIYYIVPNLET